MDLLIVSILILSIASCNTWVVHGQSSFDLLEFGAKGDGQTDDSQAILNALEALCRASDENATLVVPNEHTFFLRPLKFSGPCQSKNIHIKIMGNLLAPNRSNWGGCAVLWFHLFNITGLTFDGTGVINGSGEGWWDRVIGTGDCSRIPTALYFEKCDGLQISGLTHINGPGVHLSVVDSQNITISNIYINSPKRSHNTDGIDLTRVIHSNIHDIDIHSGDDCIAIKGGTQFLNISRVTCGPGHGISVGSLGKNGSEEFVDHLTVNNCTFNGADSAVKIKTWAGGKGYVSDIVFDNIQINETNFPIYIDQHYMRSHEQPQAVKISNVTFSNITGTCVGKDAIVLDCAKIGCYNITLQQINVTSINRKHPAKVRCNNVHGTTSDIISPPGNCI